MLWVRCARALEVLGSRKRTGVVYVYGWYRGKGNKVDLRVYRMIPAIDDRH